MTYFITLVLLFFSSPLVALIPPEPICDGPFKEVKVTRDELQNLLQQKNVNLCGINLSRVDLSSLPLEEKNLSYADLSYCDLTGTNFENSNLFKANLYQSKVEYTYFRRADLRNAYLSYSKMSHAEFSYSNMMNVTMTHAKINDSKFNYAKAQNMNARFSILRTCSLSNLDARSVQFRHAKIYDSSFSNSYLQRSNFTEAIIQKTNFRQATLQYALLNLTDLSGSDFTKAIIEDAEFERANLSGLIYQPRPGKPPNIVSLQSSQNFLDMKFYDPIYGAPGLLELRGLFKKSGLRTMEKKATLMLNRAENTALEQTGVLGKIVAYSKTFLFDWTSEYGNKPLRPLKIYVVFTLFMVIPYRKAIIFASDKAGIIIEYPDGVKVILKQTPQINLRSYIFHHFHISLQAFYFSLLSSFRIGWEDFNLAKWITAIQTQEFEMKSNGWVRVLSGLQALISIYLLLLSSLSYFGSPFET